MKARPQDDFSSQKRLEEGCPSYEVLVSGTYPSQLVKITYSPESSMLLGSNERRTIENEWRRQKRRATYAGVPLFSGRLFRLEQHIVDKGVMHLQLSQTTYKQYVGTRVPSFYRGRPRQSLANPLAVCCTLITSDGLIVVGRRKGVDVEVGAYHVVGGFLDRRIDMDPFAGMRREIVEELGISDDLDSLVCLGLVFDCLHPHYELCFAARSSLRFKDMLRLKASDVEMERPEGIMDSEEQVRVFLDREHKRIAPTGEACLLLYARFRGSLLNLSHPTS